MTSPTYIQSVSAVQMLKGWGSRRPTCLANEDLEVLQLTFALTVGSRIQQMNNFHLSHLSQSLKDELGGSKQSEFAHLSGIWKNSGVCTLHWIVPQLLNPSQNPEEGDQPGSKRTTTNVVFVRMLKKLMVSYCKLWLWYVNNTLRRSTASDFLENRDSNTISTEYIHPHLDCKASAFCCDLGHHCQELLFLQLVVGGDFLFWCLCTFDQVRQGLSYHEVARKREHKVMKC